MPWLLDRTAPARQADAKPPRLVVFNLEPIGGRGPMEHFDRAFFTALARCDLDLVWVSCDETRVPVQGYELWTPWRGIYGPAPTWRRGVRYARGLWAVLRRARLAARRSRVVIHQQFVQVPFVELPFVVAARRCGISCVLTPHDVRPYADASRSAALLPRLYRQYDALIAGSQHGRNELAALLGTSRPAIHIIPLGHLNGAYPRGTLLGRGEARDRIGVERGDAVVLFLGQIKREKGLEHALRALHLLLPRLPAARLVVAGRPYHDDVTRYERLIDDLGIGARVRRRWEYVPDDELAVYYRAADVIAVPYTRAYQSGVILTAYAFERAVVASAVGGLVEQVVDGQTGWLVPPADPAALAQALAAALADRDRADAIGARGHRWVAEQFDWDDIARQTAAVYEAVAQRRHRGRGDD
jgi:glycosyltransferase involved in cell wall biosynthesis